MVAVNDGTIKRIGHNAKLGNYVVLQDNYGNRFTYAQLGHVSKVYPVPKQHKLSGADFKLVTPEEGQGAEQPATRGKPLGVKSVAARPAMPPRSTPSRKTASANATPAPPRRRSNTEDLRQRLYALPERPHNVDRAGITGQLDHLLSKKFPGYSTFKSYFGGVLHFNRSSMELRPLRKGSQVVAGTVLGRVGKTGKLAPHVNFAIRPAGQGAPKIDPKPILDGWKLLEATAIYRAAGKNPFSVHGRGNVTQDLLMPKTAAGAPGARRPAPLDLRLRAQRHPDRPDRPADPRGDGVPRRQRLPADDHLAQVRPQLPDHLRQRLRAHDRRRDGHRRGERHPDRSATRARARSPKR